MTLPVLTVITIIFIIWINYEIHKHSKRSREDTEMFWEREKESNFSRRSDISALDYIQVSTGLLPMKDSLDESLNDYRNIIFSLNGKKAINLYGYTNTELKYKYGIANFNELIQYDSNYITLVSNLQKWAKRLYQQGNTEDASIVLEYAVSCKTDVINSYLLLADIYKLQNHPEKINSLIDAVSSMKARNKDKIIEKLTTMVNS